MKRRSFLLGAGAATLLGRQAAAQPASNAPVVGMLWVNSAEVEARLGYAAICRAGLADFGSTDGKTIRIEERFGDGTQKRADELAQELVALKVDVIVTAAEGGRAATLATKTIPIVSATQGDPVAEGFAASLAHPGGNFTGNAVFFPQIMVKRLERLKQVAPKLARAGVLAPEVKEFVRFTFDEMAMAATPIGIDLKLVEATGAAAYQHAFAPGGGLDVFVILDLPVYFRDFDAIAADARQSQIPTAGAPAYARAGGLVGYGVYFPALFRSAGAFVDKILRGARPGDIPIEQPTRFETVFNLKTAAALGVTVPPALLAAADEVIE